MKTIKPVWVPWSIATLALSGCVPSNPSWWFVNIHSRLFPAIYVLSGLALLLWVTWRLKWRGHLLRTWAAAHLIGALLGGLTLAVIGITAADAIDRVVPRDLASFASAGAIFGFASGLVTSLMVREHLRRPFLWPPIGALAWGSTLPLTLLLMDVVAPMMSSPDEQSLLLIIALALAALMPAIVQGIFLAYSYRPGALPRAKASIRQHDKPP